MRNLFRGLFVYCMAVLVAASVLFSPANAASMLNCEAHPSELGAVSLVHAHSQKVAAEADVPLSVDLLGAHEHSETECINHNCVFALSNTQFASKLLSAPLFSGLYSSDRSLVAQAGPEGLQRPPRS